MRHRGMFGRVGAVTAATLTASLLAGCTTLPADESWTPPSWPENPAVVSVLTGPNDRSGSQADPAKPGGSSPTTAPGAQTGAFESVTAGLIDGRVRNDRAGLQARYVEVHGMSDFNGRVAGIVDAAIAGTGVSSFTPEVFDASAGLSDRGCAEGTSTMPATELLADPAYGPVDGVGTAVVCEVTAAFGPILGVGFRTVTGDGEEVSRDEIETLFVDLESGAVTDASTLWTPEAATTLWTEAVQTLRRSAGALSAAPVQSPSDEQLALARAALATVRVADATAQFTLPRGVSSDELVALGVDQTQSALTVTLPGATFPAGWLTPEGEQLLGHRGRPFVGVPTWNAAHAVDCSIAACVAVTYDDGPSGFTAELLDTLAAQESAATFFMLGNAVPGYADVVARAAGDGHELASHSMTHPDLTTITPSAARREVLNAGKAITAVTGQPVTMYRPPYGAVNSDVLDAVNLPAILWSIDTLDWEDPGEQALIDRAATAANPGDIILFHDTHADTINAADDVYTVLKDRGFTPVTVTQLFSGAVPMGRVSGL